MTEADNTVDELDGDDDFDDELDNEEDDADDVNRIPAATARAVLDFLVARARRRSRFRRGRCGRRATGCQPARDGRTGRPGPRHRQARSDRERVRTVVRAAAVRDGVEVDVDFVD